MAYNPLENEMVIGCYGAIGGTIGKTFPFVSTADVIPVIVAIHPNNNLWIEVEGSVGFSIDKDIAVALLNKIANVGVMYSRQGVVSDQDIYYSIELLDMLLERQDKTEDVKKAIESQHAYALHLINKLGLQNKYEYSEKPNGSKRIIKK